MAGKLVLDGLQKATTLSLFAVTCTGAYTVGNGLYTLRERRLAAAEAANGAVTSTPATAAATTAVVAATATTPSPTVSKASATK